MRNLANHFAILGLPSNASMEEVSAAHRRLVVLCHPDRVNGNSHLKLAAEEHTKRLNAARDEISQVLEARTAQVPVSAGSSPSVDLDPCGSDELVYKKEPLPAIAKWTSILTLCFGCLGAIWISRGYDPRAIASRAEPISDLKAVERICSSDLANLYRYNTNRTVDDYAALTKYCEATERLAVDSKQLAHNGRSFGIVFCEYSDSLRRLHSLFKPAPHDAGFSQDEALQAWRIKVGMLRASVMSEAARAGLK